MRHSHPERHLNRSEPQVADVTKGYGSVHKFLERGNIVLSRSCKDVMEASESPLIKILY